MLKLVRFLNSLGFILCTQFVCTPWNRCSKSVNFLQMVFIDCSFTILFALFKCLPNYFFFVFFNWWHSNEQTGHSEVNSKKKNKQIQGEARTSLLGFFIISNDKRTKWQLYDSKWADLGCVTVPPLCENQCIRLFNTKKHNNKQRKTHIEKSITATMN